MNTLLADLILVVHFAFVLFVVGGLAAIWIGAAAGWGWVRDIRFRVAHLAAIGVVAAQAWLGELCPLSVLEMRLRSLAGDSTYAGAFAAHWLGRVLYYDAPAWAFTAAYTAFAALVGAACIRYPPRRSP